MLLCSLTFYMFIDRPLLLLSANLHNIPVTTSRRGKNKRVRRTFGVFICMLVDPTASGGLLEISAGNASRLRLVVGCAPRLGRSLWCFASDSGANDFPDLFPTRSARSFPVPSRSTKISGSPTSSRQPNGFPPSGHIRVLQYTNGNLPYRPSGRPKQNSTRRG